jgi:hypothetical protein
MLVCASARDNLVREKTMQRKVVRTTLGELIVALTDEMMPPMDDPSRAYEKVAEILETLMERRRVRLQSLTQETLSCTQQVTDDDAGPRIH